MPTPPQSLHLRLVGAEGVGIGSAQASDPISILEVDHALKIEFCDLLEGIADSLPYETDPSLVDVAVTILREGLPDHIALEEHHLFPMLRRRNDGGCCCETVLSQLEHEHSSDEAFGYEIAEELERLTATKEARNAEMLGYMLRGFFISQRRHVQWENAVVLPLARQVLNEADLEELMEAIVERSRRHEGRQVFKWVSGALSNSGEGN